MTDTSRDDRREPRRASAVSPEAIEDLTLAIQTAGSDIARRYDTVHDASYSRARYGDTGGGSSGHGDPTASDFEVTRKVRAHLEQASKSVHAAYTALQRAQNELFEAEQAIDSAHPLTVEPIERDRERTVAKRELLETHWAKVQQLNNEIDRADRELKATAARRGDPPPKIVTTATQLTLRRMIQSQELLRTLLKSAGTWEPTRLLIETTDRRLIARLGQGD